jgi:hypothetical protein
MVRQSGYAIPGVRTTETLIDISLRKQTSTWGAH